MANRPGGAIMTRPMHFIWIADCSGSMAQDGKIQALNMAIREAIPHMRKVADDNPHASLLVRAISFSTGARWHVADPTPIEQFRWPDLQAKGNTDLGVAVSMVTEEMNRLAVGDKVLPPVLALITDGHATDKNYLQAITDLLETKLGHSATRVGIAIGDDADIDVLAKFIDNPAVRVLRAHNPDELIKYIRWASTTVLKGTQSLHVNVPIPQPSDTPSAGDQVW